MNAVFETLVLGLVQGVSEFLPISSSGHLSALELIAARSSDDGGVGPSITLNVILHFATLLAVIVVFWKEVVYMAKGVFAGGEGRRLFFLVLLGAVPAGFAGLFARDLVEDLPTAWPWSVPLCWLFTAGALWSLRGRVEPEGPRELGVGVALWIGCWQILALLPGVSRSGITVAAALWARCRREDAASFSFLMSIPLIAGATGLEVVHIVRGDATMDIGTSALVVGGLVAFGGGWLALKLLLRFIRQGTLHRWAYYLVAVALAFGLWLLTGAPGE